MEQHCKQPFQLVVGCRQYLKEVNMKIPCYVCQKEMTIDEPNGEAYTTDGLIITWNTDGTPKTIDDSNKKIRHPECVGD